MNHEKTAITKIRTGPAMFAVMLAGASSRFLKSDLNQYRIASINDSF